MRMYDLIQRKRNGGVLSDDEIRYIISGFTNGEIPDYQMSAMLMAIYFKGLNEKETLTLTLEMAHSGDMLDLSAIQGKIVDKHSTGGVGDKTSLILAPMVAAFGVPVAKMSGRGLGHTGGTIDKLESIPGFSTTLTTDDFRKNVNKIKLALVGQTANLAPADKKLYALRDVTATVDQISLIASSIMSKKLAAGADAIVLDVKTGSGALIKREEDSIALARAMVKIGKGAGRKTTAIISDMDQPLGFSIGNALEIKEVIETLKGNGPKDLTELCLVLGAHMLFNVEAVPSIEEAMEQLKEIINNGSALEKFIQFIKAQGGDENAIHDTSLLPSASITEDVLAPCEGYIIKMFTDKIGTVSMTLGGGRQTKEGDIDLSVGLVLHKKTGDFVKPGEVLATLHANDKEKLRAAKEQLLEAYKIAAFQPSLPPLIHAIIA